MSYRVLKALRRTRRRLFGARRRRGGFLAASTARTTLVNGLLSRRRLLRGSPDIVGPETRRRSGCGAVNGPPKGRQYLMR